jgi:hypothetical protein
MTQERQAVIDRAHHLQFLNTSEGYSAHSTILKAQVFKVRSMQESNAGKSTSNTKKERSIRKNRKIRKRGYIK